MNERDDWDKFDKAMRDFNKLIKGKGRSYGFGPWNPRNHAPNVPSEVQNTSDNGEPHG